MSVFNPQPRPYWHVDAKWMGGILAFFALGAALLLFNLAAMTERSFAVPTSAAIVASLFSKNGLDDEQGVAAFRQQVAASPADPVAPISQFPSLKISRHDALTLNARDLRIAIFSQLTGPIYDLGVSGAAKQFTSNPADQATFANQASLLGLLTGKTHALLQQAFWISAFAAVFLLLVVVYFSAGWGRVVSPGVLLLLLSVPGTFVGLALSFPHNGGSALGPLPPSTLQSIGHSMMHSYQMATIAGAGLLVVALVGKVVQHFVMSGKHEALKPAK